MRARRASRLRGGGPRAGMCSTRTYSAGRGRRGACEKRSDRYDLLPAANSVSPAARANRVCVHPSFPFHGSPGGAAPSPRSAPSFKVTDCLLYYPLVSIFTHSSSAASHAESLRVFLSAAQTAPLHTLFGQTRSACGACKRRATRAFYADRMCFTSEGRGPSGMTFPRLSGNS